MDLDAWNDEHSCCLDAVLCVRAVEFAIIIITAAVTIPYVRVLMKAKILHVNLRILFIASALADLSITSIRLFDITNFSGETERTSFKSFFQNSLWMISTLILPSIICERIYAVWAFRHYDESSDKFPRTCILILVGKASMSFISSAFVFAGFGDPYLLMNIALLIDLLIIPQFFIYLYYSSKNAKREMEIRYRLMSNNLSGRYQLLETERSLHMLKWLIPYRVLCTLILSVGSMVTLMLVQSHAPRYLVIVNDLLYITVGPRVVGGYIIALRTHPALRKEWGRIRCFSSPSMTTITVGTQSVVRSDGAHIAVTTAAGRQLNFAPDREQDMYFQRYAW